jgi:c-di-GMP-binding flagellar brake protein YcgR
MSNETSSNLGGSAGAKQIERMLRVSPLTIGAVYKKGDRVGQGYVLNLSRGGVFLSTTEAFEMNSEFRLRFFLPFQLGQVDALVAVRWRTRDVDNPPKQLRTGLGCEFVEIAPEMQDKIDQFIDRFVELADQLDDG